MTQKMMADPVSFEIGRRLFESAGEEIAAQNNGGVSAFMMISLVVGVFDAAFECIQDNVGPEAALSARDSVIGGLKNMQVDGNGAVN